MTTKETLTTLCENYAEQHNYQLNPDEKRLELVLNGLLKREKNFGLLYCPCRVVTGDPNVDGDIVCPCVFCESDIAQNGCCHCRLYFKKE